MNNVRTIVCPHCNKEIKLDLILTDIRKLELGIGIKVFKEQAKEKEKQGKKTKKSK
ncbi:MAG: hypothetical protein V3T58_04730 [Candidatus Hydrothermarchaeales archaeon]